MIACGRVNCTEARWHDLSKKNGTEFSTISVPDIGNIFVMESSKKVQALAIICWWTKACIAKGIRTHVDELIGL